MKRNPLHIIAALIVLLTAGVLFAPSRAGHAQDFGVTVTPTREQINVRVAPAIGHDVVGTLLLGQVVDATGRTQYNDWFRIDFFGAEGWVASDVVSVSGDPDVLPLGDPPIAPLDFGAGPLAGPSAASSANSVRLPRSGIRFRAGPSEAYFYMGNVPRFEVVAVTGRTPDGQWLQVNYRGQLGWIANLGDYFLEWQTGSLEAVPAWGVVADAAPGTQPDIGPSATRDALMTAMLLHIDLSVNRLDFISGIWSTIARGGTVGVCSVDFGPPQTYIPRREDLNAYPEMDPVIAAINEGLEETGRAIELWEDWCAYAAQDYPGGAELVEPALEALSNARRGYTSAREQIFALGLVPTPTPAPPALTPVPQVPTVTAPAPLPDIMAFGLEGNRVLFAPQFTYPDLGCAWQGIGGQVIGLSGEPLLGFTVRVEGITDPTLVLETVSGGATAYGPSGWEVKVADGVNSHVFRVTLFQDDRRVSDPRIVSFPNDCARNLALMNFNQLTPLE